MLNREGLFPTKPAVADKAHLYQSSI